LPLKKGDTASKPYQLLFDSLIDGSLLKNQSKVNELKKGVRYCYGRSAQVSISSVCSKCYKDHPRDWIKCPEVLKDAGIESPNMPTGKIYKGAIR